MTAAEREAVAGRDRGEREGRGLEGGVAPRAAHDSREQRSRARRRALRARGRARSRRPGRRPRRRGRRPARPARGCARSPAPRAARLRARPRRTAPAPSAGGRQRRTRRPRRHRDRPRRSRRRGRIAAPRVYRVPRGNPLDLLAVLHWADARKHQDHPARRPRRGGQEHDRVSRSTARRVVIDAGLAFPRDEHLGVDLILPDFSYLRDRRRPVRAVLLTHGHEDHVGALPYLLREVARPRGLGDAAHARARQVEARRARPAALHGAARGRPRGRARSSSARSRVEFVRVAHSIPDAVAIVLDDARRPRSCTRATTSSTTRPSTGSRPTSARSPSSATAASTCCSATRRTPSGPGVTGSERLVGEAFRQIIPPRTGRDPGRLVRLERPPDAAGDRRRDRGRPQGLRRRPLDAQEPEHRAQPRLPRRARRRADPAERARTTTRRTRC